MIEAVKARYRRWLWKRRDEADSLILTALLRHPDQSGWPLMQATGLGSGRLYVALARLEKSRLVESRWTDCPCPRRRLYRLSYSYRQTSQR
jgi:DNA-binding PadR family transcriptional regulator